MPIRIFSFALLSALMLLSARAQMSEAQLNSLADSLERVLAQPAEDPARIPLLLQMGHIRMQQPGKVAQALPYFTEAKALAVKNGQATAQGRALGGMSGVYEHQGEYKLALAMSKEAAALLLPVDTLLTAMFELNIGHLLGAYFKKYDGAVTHLQSAISLLGGRSDPQSLRYLAMAYSEGGIASLAAGNKDEAAGMLLKALQMQRAIGDKQGEAMTCRHLTNVYINKENYAKAHEYLDKALTINQENGNDPIVMLGIWLNRGEAFYGEKRYKEAIPAFEEAAKYALQVPMYTHAQMAFESLAKLHRMAGDKAKARQYRAKAKACERDTHLTEQQAS